MRSLMIAVVGVCLLSNSAVPLSADIVVNGPAMLLPGYSPNPTGGEYPTYLSPNGDFMLVKPTGVNDVKSRTLTGIDWGALTDVPGITGTGYNYATLSPDGQSLFTHGNGGYIQRSKLQTNGTWSTPVTIVPGDYNVAPYFNGSQLFFQHAVSGSADIMVYDYNSASDTFVNGRAIPALHGSGGNGYSVRWVSQNGTDMIANYARSDGTGDIYSVQYGGSNWMNPSPLPSLHKDSVNIAAGVAENVGKLVFNSNKPNGPETIWQAPVSITPPPPPKTYAILVGSRAPGWLEDRTEVADAIRGDLDVDHVAAKLTWATQVTSIKVNWNDADTLATSIQTAVNAIAPKIIANDTLLFYYSGHGSGNSTNGTNEAINAINGGQYFDNSLQSVLSDARLTNARKLVLLDSCRSGGFWSDDYVGDQDLQHLSNVAFLAAATEDANATAEADGTGTFTNAILPYLNQNTTFAQLEAYAAAAHSGNVTGFFKLGGYGTVTWSPLSSYSPDFDPQLQIDGNAVPEPSTLVLLGIGALGLLAWAWRRRRA